MLFLIVHIKSTKVAKNISENIYWSCSIVKCPVFLLDRTTVTRLEQVTSA